MFMQIVYVISRLHLLYHLISFEDRIMLYSNNYHFLHGFPVIRIHIFTKTNEAESLQKKSGQEGGNLKLISLK